MGKRCKGVDETMSGTAEYISNILTEIEEGQERFLTTAEVAQRLLGRNDTGCPSSDSPTQMSQDEIIDTVNFENQVSSVNATWNIPYYRPLASHRKIIGRTIVFFKKAVRRILKFLLLPVIEDQNQFNASTTNAINAIRNNDIVFLQSIKQLVEENANIKQHVERLETQLEENMNKHLSNSSASKIYDSINYATFENEFRGGQEKIKERQQGYVKVFKDCKKVIDLGSGRGEFLELLRDNHIPAIGVDQYEPFVEESLQKCLCAKQGDAITYLREQSDTSCDGIFSAQLVEHLQAEDIIALCGESFRVLDHGGKLVIETPNPTCVSTYLNSFYLDPTHNNPVHPKTLKFFLQQAGFSNIRIVFNEQSRIPYRLPLLEVENANLAEFNDGINFLSDVIFGCQDYAIIAEKE